MRTILFAAVALALYSGANAAPITTTQSTSFESITGLVATDTTSSGGAVTASADKTLSFDRFNATTGVLTGVSSGLSFTGGTLALNAYGTEVKSGSGKPAFASSGTVSASSGVFSFGQINGPLSNSCSDSGSKCFDGNSNLSGRTSMQKSDTTWTNVSAGPSTANLNSYVGTGTWSSTLTVTNSVSITGLAKINSPEAKLTTNLTGGNQSITYSYLRHADASFSSGANTSALTLDAGSVFSIFNFGDASTAKLDSAGIQCLSGECGAFNVTLSFQDLAAGGSVAGHTALTAVGGGSHTATYKLLFSDDTAVGATGTHLQDSLLLTVQSGPAAVPAVPEPSEWAMLTAGLLVIGFIARRRRQIYA